MRWQRAKRRAGSATVKTRAEVKATGAKPWKQKGTGRARAGRRSSPIWVGGGVAHGPKARKYEFRLNKKERQKALCSVLTTRNLEEKIFVVEDFGLKEIKTKAAAAVLVAAGLKPGAQRILVIAPMENSEILTKSLRNIDRLKVIDVAGLNVYDVLSKECLVFVGDALEAVQSRLLG